MMSTTERLYYHDSRLLEFDARVISLSETDDGQMLAVQRELLGRGAD